MKSIQIFLLVLALVALASARTARRPLAVDNEIVEADAEDKSLLEVQDKAEFAFLGKMVGKIAGKVAAKLAKKFGKKIGKLGKKIGKKIGKKGGQGEQDGKEEGGEEAAVDTALISSSDWFDECRTEFSYSDCIDESKRRERQIEPRIRQYAGQLGQQNLIACALVKKTSMFVDCDANIVVAQACYDPIYYSNIQEYVGMQSSCFKDLCRKHPNLGQCMSGAFFLRQALIKKEKDDAAAALKEENDAAAKKLQDEAAAKKLQDDAAAKKLQDDEAAEGDAAETDGEVE